MSAPQAKASVSLVKIALIAMLLFALNGSNPYGYYQLLRWACFGVLAYLAYDSAARGNAGWAWTFGMFALLYNPIAKFALGREIWMVMNIVTAATLAYSMYAA